MWLPLAKKRLSIKKVFSKSVKLYYKHFLLFTSIIFCGQFFHILDDIFEVSPFPVDPNYGIIVRILGVLLSSMITILFIHLVVDRSKKRKRRLSKLLEKCSIKQLLRYLILSMVYMIIIAFGLLLLVIPFFWFLAIFALAEYILIIEYRILIFSIQF